MSASHYYYLLFFLKLSQSWPLVVLTIFFLFRRSLNQLLSSIQTIQYKDFVLQLHKANIPPEQIGYYLSMIKPSKYAPIKFSCKATTKNIKQKTGNGISIPINFANSSSNAINGTFTAPQSGTYFVMWKIFLEGITNQTEAAIQVQSSNKVYSFPINNLSALKDQGHIVLTNTTLIPMDVADTVKLTIKVGTEENQKTVAISSSSEAEFSGFLI